MPWRSSSFTMAVESSRVRSVNSGVICGAVTRRMRKPKKPTSATVTAHIAAIRAAPSDLRKSSNPCTGIRPDNIRPGKICLVDGYCPVNFGAIAVERSSRLHKCNNPADTAGQWQTDSNCGLLPVLLDARGAQAGEAVLVDGILPGEEFLDSQRVATAGFLERKQAAPYSGNHLGLTPNDPALGAGRR